MTTKDQFDNLMLEIAGRGAIPGAAQQLIFDHVSALQQRVGELEAKCANLMAASVELATEKNARIAELEVKCAELKEKYGDQFCQLVFKNQQLEAFRAKVKASEKIFLHGDVDKICFAVPCDAIDDHIVDANKKVEGGEGKEENG